MLLCLSLCNSECTEKLLRPCLPPIKSRHTPLKTNPTFTAYLLQQWLREKDGELTPRGSRSMSRSLESCQSYKEKSITEARERCNICHSQMNSSYFFPIGHVCTLWESDLTMANLMASCLQLSQDLIYLFCIWKRLVGDMNQRWTNNQWKICAAAITKETFKMLKIQFCSYADAGSSKGVHVSETLLDWCIFIEPHKMIIQLNRNVSKTLSTKTEHHDLHKRGIYDTVVFNCISFSSVDLLGKHPIDLVVKGLWATAGHFISLVQNLHLVTYWPALTPIYLR